MPVIATQGFGVQAQPGINYLPANQLVPNLSNIVPAASQGAGLVSQLSQIQNEAQLAPVRRALQQIQLQDAQNKLSLFPGEQQLQQIHVATAGQPIETPQGVSLAQIARPVAPEDTPALDENGNRTVDPNAEPPPTDLMKQSVIKVFDPVTGQTTYRTQNTGVQSTAEEQDIEGARVEDINAQAEQRLKGKTATAQKLIDARDNAMQSGDTETVGQLNAIINKMGARPGIISANDINEREIAKQAALVGVPFQQYKQLASTPDGAKAASKMYAAARMSIGGHPDFTGTNKLTAKEQAAVANAFTPAQTAPAQFTVPGLGGATAAQGAQAAQASAIPTVSTQADYDALAAGAPYIDSETGQQHIKGQ